MKLRGFLAAIGVFLAAGVDSARAMGSGPHPHLLYALPPETHQAGMSPGLSGPGWLALSLFLLALVGAGTVLVHHQQHSVK